MSEFVFSAKPGSRLTDKDAARIGPVLARLAADDRLTREAIVAAAAPQRAPLHRYFEWDDSEAARLYRLEQAGQIRRCILVRPIDEPDQEPVRAFVKTVRRDEDEERFADATTIRDDAFLTTQELERFKRDIRRLIRQYNAWRRFVGFEAADVLLRAAEDFLRRAA